MPNGDPVQWKKEFPKIQTFFNKISNVLEQFASSHNLMVEKYYHEGASWTFRFRHPRGGQAGIQLLKLSSEEEIVGIGTAWQIADYDACTLYSKHTEIEKCSLEESVLLEALTRHLKLVLSWQKEDLTSAGGKYEEWKKHPREKIEGDVLKYPIPKID